MKLICAVILCVLMGVVGQLLLKSGVGIPDSNIPAWESYLKIFTSSSVLIGMLCYILSSLLWLLILQRAHLSFVYPMISLGYVLVVLASVIFFHETVSILRWTGVGVICIGVTLVASSGTT